jgi:hypothetical protein
MRLSRRGTLGAGGVGIVTAVATYFGVSRFTERVRAQGATPAANATPTGEIQVGDMWLCDQRYALCTTAPCELVADDSTIASCRCRVERGYSLGFSACSARVPKGTSLISTFSTVDVTPSLRALVCPDGNRWANCLDIPCEIDADDPAGAVCHCQLVASGEFVTLGGACDTSTCSFTIWSGDAVGSAVLSNYETAMAKAGQTAVVPDTCPDEG